MHKLITTLEEATLQEEVFDVVYFDAFAPGKQPEVWSLQNFRKCFLAMKAGGILTTYSSQGQVKRNMEESGFSVEKIAGAAGKREMLRAKKPS
ncbi:MAG: MnmC family methyltransferase [Bacteroidales bacterium]|nr:MnmC family methyltransferase [Bacteroidales bacterium]